MTFLVCPAQTLIAQQPYLSGHELVEHGLEEGLQGGQAVLFGSDFVSKCREIVHYGRLLVRVRHRYCDALEGGLIYAGLICLVCTP